MLALASETVLAGLGFSRTVVFVRQANDEFQARLGLGPKVEKMLPALRFDAAFQPDVFHLAISNPVGHFYRERTRPADRRALAAMVQERSAMRRRLFCCP